MTEILLFFAAIVVHESGHFLAARLLHIPLVSFSVTPIGLRMRFDFSCAGYLSEAIVHAGGSIAGVIVGAATALVPLRAARIFCGISLCFSALNLLPISSLDGGGILSAVLSLALLPDAAWRIGRAVSLLTVLAMWGAVLWCELRVGANLALICFICALLLAEVTE